MNSNTHKGKSAKDRTVLPVFEAAYPATDAYITAIHRLNQYSPFNSPGYAAACAEIGKIPCAFVLRAGLDIVSGCLGFMESGIFSRCLEIVTVPQVLHPAEFWTGIIDFCRRQSVWDLVVGSFGSTSADIPSLPGELNRLKRYEFAINLDTPDLIARMSRSNRNNVKRAMKAGLVVRKAHGPEASQTHLILIQASMARRRSRGEDIRIPVRNDPLFEKLLKNGDAEIFQAYGRGRTLSSLLVLRCADSAYSLSTGTSPTGMKTGASAYVLVEAARILGEKGVRIFNLGGCRSDEESLRSFKAGFGGQVLSLEAASFSLVSPIKRKLRKTARLVLADFCSFLTVSPKK